MSPGRRLVPSLLCVGMALVPLLALRGGNFGAARTTVSVAAGDAPVSDPPAGRQVPGRASRSEATRSVDAAGTAVPAPTAELVSAAAPGGASIASITSAPASTPVIAKPHPVAARRSSPRPVTPPRSSPPRPSPPPPPSETGEASWYGAPAGTCAHPSLPLGTIVTVTDVETGRATTCRVADRGPYATGRVIDLSAATFAQLAPLAVGVIEVRLTW